MATYNLVVFVRDGCGFCKTVPRIEEAINDIYGKLVLVNRIYNSPYYQLPDGTKISVNYTPAWILIPNNYQTLNDSNIYYGRIMRTPTGDYQVMPPLTNTSNNDNKSVIHWLSSYISNNTNIDNNPQLPSKITSSTDKYLPFYDGSNYSTFRSGSHRN